MKISRRHFLSRTVGVFPVVGLAPGALAACEPSVGEDASQEASQDASGQEAPPHAVGSWEPLEKSEDEWRRLLSAEEFAILRDEDTEPPFTSPLNAEKRRGTFICAGCFLPLFSSATKYESGTGWPSFWQPIEGQVDTKWDFKMIIPRTEYHCARCGGHQGHVFGDGPQPTGKRWCNNGLALDFVPEGESLPALRS